jgi:predicted phosphodiesterase
VKIAVCGGVYSNPYALRAFISDARRRGADRLYCLGDLGGYGAEPDAVWEVLTRHDIECIAGNYDVAIAAGSPDCGCGYVDPRDREYAQIMYDFTAAATSPEFGRWMSTLATERRESLGGCTVHFVHGSPAGLSDFWWESLSPAAHSARVRDSGAEVVFCTHSGLPWTRRVDGSLVVNVGVIGRPPNDGGREVRYALATLSAGQATAQIVRLPYDWQAQARSMRQAGLPEAFVRTTETGWWTTCLEILPAEERSRGRYHIYDSSVAALLDMTGCPASAWPDTDPAIPVRSLVGSPLLPARLWLSSPDLLTAALAGEAAAAGLTDVRVLGHAPEPPVRQAAGPAGRPAAELTLSPAGWHWHPAMLGDGPFLPAASDRAPTGSATRPPASLAVRAAALELLTQLFGTGSLALSRSCAT